MYLTKYPHPVALLFPKTAAGKSLVNLVKTELNVNCDGVKEDASILVCVKYSFFLESVISKIVMNTTLD